MLSICRDTTIGMISIETVILLSPPITKSSPSGNCTGTLVTESLFAPHQADRRSQQRIGDLPQLIRRAAHKERLRFIALVLQRKSIRQRRKQDVGPHGDLANIVAALDIYGDRSGLRVQLDAGHAVAVGVDRVQAHVDFKRITAG